MSARMTTAIMTVSHFQNKMIPQNDRKNSSSTFPEMMALGIFVFVLN